MPDEKNPFRLPDQLPDVPALRGGDRREKKTPFVLPNIEPYSPPDPQGVSPHKVGGVTVSDVQEYRRLLREIARRRCEALRLYEPLPIQLDFHNSAAKQRLIRGGNRSAKTTAAAIEVARALTGVDAARKYPKENGRAFLVGRDEKHLGKVMYRKLFQSGAIRMIRDEYTLEWRSYRPWVAADQARESEAKFAPPLIPQRFVKSKSWKSKASGIPDVIVLANGWEIDFLSSLGKPPQGADLDLVWFDEEIVDGAWHPEMIMRLMDRKGCLIWSATPQAGTDRLLELHLRCEAELAAWAERGMPPTEEPQAREFVVSTLYNPHISDSEKKEAIASVDDGDYAVRIGGEFAVQAAKIYPEFSDNVHGLPYFDIPHDWTRYAVVDPGRQVCAVLFAAVPPPDAELPLPVGRVGDNRYVVLYDELYIQNCSAALFGERMGQRCVGQQFEAFLIDSHGSRVTEMGSGMTIEQQYSDALEQNGVSCIRTGSGFTWGGSDVLGGLEAVRNLLRIRAKVGFPTLFVADLPNKLPNLKWEIERYRYKRENGKPTDKPEEKGRVHAMACLRYLAMYDPQYVEPRKGVERFKGAYGSFLSRQASRRKEPSGLTNFGPRKPPA